MKTISLPFPVPKGLFDVTSGGILRCTDIRALFQTPQAKRQLDAVERLRRRRETLRKV